MVEILCAALPSLQRRVVQHLRPSDVGSSCGTTWLAAKAAGCQLKSCFLDSFKAI